jgi:hypothetical protein
LFEDPLLNMGQKVSQSHRTIFRHPGVEPVPFEAVDGTDAKSISLVCHCILIGKTYSSVTAPDGEYNVVTPSNASSTRQSLGGDLRTEDFAFSVLKVAVATCLSFFPAAVASDVLRIGESSDDALDAEASFFQPNMDFDSLRVVHVVQAFLKSLTVTSFEISRMRTVLSLFVAIFQPSYEYCV